MRRGRSTVTRRLAKAPSGDAGFTLLEVLVAFAVAAPTIALLFSQGASSVGAAKKSAVYQEAISRAKSRLETLSGPALSAGARTGDDGDGFHWRTEVTSIQTLAASRQVPGGTRNPAQTTLFDVVVEVTWPGHSNARGVILNTRRIAATPAREP